MAEPCEIGWLAAELGISTAGVRLRCSHKSRQFGDTADVH
jgi:hypothetical protein